MSYFPHFYVIITRQENLIKVTYSITIMMILQLEVLTNDTCCQPQLWMWTWKINRLAKQRALKAPRKYTQKFWCRPIFKTLIQTYVYPFHSRSQIQRHVYGLYYTFWICGPAKLQTVTIQSHGLFRLNSSWEKVYTTNVGKNATGRFLAQRPASNFVNNFLCLVP